MAKALEKSTLEWVRDNLPRSATLDPDKTRDIVKRVLTETQTFRSVLSAVGSVVGGFAGLGLAEHWSISENSRALYFGTIVLGGIVVGLLLTAVGQIYLHRKLEAAFESA